MGSVSFMEKIKKGPLRILSAESPEAGLCDGFIPEPLAAIIWNSVMAALMQRSTLRFWSSSTRCLQDAIYSRDIHAFFNRTKHHQHSAHITKARLHSDGGCSPGFVLRVHTLGNNRCNNLEVYKGLTLLLTQKQQQSLWENASIRLLNLSCVTF